MTASGAATVERLRAVPLFAELDDRALERVSALSAEVDVPAGQVLIEPGQPGTGLFVVVDGTVEVELRGKPTTLGPGEFVGELSVLVEDAPRSVRVRAATDVRCLALTRADFEELLEEEPRIGVAMARGLARRLLAMVTR